MNKVIEFAFKQHPDLLKMPYKVPNDTRWLKSPTGNKVIWCTEHVETCDPNTTTVIGGICGTKATSLTEMGQLETMRDFFDWHTSWYPRIDQMHDAIGIPPKLCKKVVYVFEDTSHALRIQRIKPNWNVDQIAEILREVHKTQGHPMLCNWLMKNGYLGEVSYVFLSEIERETSCAIRIAKKFGFKTESKEKETRKLMYTSLWKSVLGIEKDAVIYEPIHYVNRHYHSYGSMLDTVAILSYIPFLTKDGIDSFSHNDARKLRNYLSIDTQSFSEEETRYLALNLLFMKDVVLNEGVENLSVKECTSLLVKDFKAYQGMIRLGFSPDLSFSLYTPAEQARFENNASLRHLSRKEEKDKW